MSHDESADGALGQVPDVTSQRLAALLGQDPELDRAVRDVLAQLGDRLEVALGWHSYIGGGTDSVPPNSTG